MSSPLAAPVPLLLQIPGSTVEEIAIFCVAILVAVTVSAESQGFAATFLGDMQQGGGKRFHFNAFLHLDLLGTLCFFIAGFGWAKEVEIDVTRFKHPRFYLLLSRLAGPLGNFLMASIAASLVWMLGEFGWEDKVFSGLIVVNMMMAVYGLFFIPPLPGAALLSAILPDTHLGRSVLNYMRLAGPVLLPGVFLLVRFQHWDLSHFAVNSIVRSGCVFLQSFTL